MTERVDRRGDEKLYQPQIHSDRIRALYKVKLLTGLPLTFLVDQAIRELLAKYEIKEDDTRNGDTNK